MRIKGPIAGRGARIGLLGGSFDPPHDGHRLITERALKSLRLDQIWWLVSPGNPLKEESPADLTRRLAAARAVANHPRVRVTAIEAQMGTRYTVDTLMALKRRFPVYRFVWLMGADNLAGFHRWQHWDKIAETVPIAVFARPGFQVRAGLSKTAQRYARWRVPSEAAASLADRAAPAWSLCIGPTSPLSSTQLRNTGAWNRGEASS